MKEELEKLLIPGRHICREINVQGIPELEHLYGARIPVLVAGNQELCQARIDRDVVMAYLNCCLAHKASSCSRVM
jgi:hypothetical protein